MQFTLRDLLLLFVVLASALVAFHFYGILLFLFISLIAAWRRCTIPSIHSLLELLIIPSAILFFYYVFTLFIPQSCHVTPEGRRAYCLNNMKQIGIALSMYQESHQHLPLAHTKDPQGRLMHSWRTMILPMMEEGPLYDQYKQDEPWNGPANRKLATYSIAQYDCPSDSKRVAHTTNYVVITGPNTLWPDDHPGSLKDIPDGADKTILAIEAAQTNITWTKPRDFSLRQMEDLLNSESSEVMIPLHTCQSGRWYQPHIEGINVLFADGAARTMSKEYLRNNLKALVTSNGGEPLDINEGDASHILEKNMQFLMSRTWLEAYGPTFLFIASSLLLVFWSVKKTPKPSSEVN
jgi:prepilin-type processing-associated H-X9-DG protein